MSDIPSVQQAGQRLGSVVFSETFVESTVPVVNQGRQRAFLPFRATLLLLGPDFLGIFVLVSDQSKSLDGKHVILTGNVPRFICWPVRLHRVYTGIQGFSFCSGYNAILHHYAHLDSDFLTSLSSMFT